MGEIIVHALYKAGRALAVAVYSVGMQLWYWRHRVAGRIEIDWAAIPFNRVAVLNLLLAKKAGARYLEIGCAGNIAFNSVIAADKIGVDPAAGGTHRMTSDAFFAGTDAKFDVIFIDGLHTYEQVRRDVQQALLHLNSDGWIVLHDLFPRDWREEHVPCLYETWTGDVWKVAFELKQTPGVEFALLQIDMGVGIVKPLASTRAEAVQLADLTAELTPRHFDYFYAHHRELPLKTYPEGRQWIEQRL